MLGSHFLFISLAVYASGQGLSYYGSSNVRNQDRLPPRSPLNSYRPPPYPSAPNPIRPVYSPTQPIYQPPQPVYQPPQPVYQPSQRTYQPSQYVYQPPQSSYTYPPVTPAEPTDAPTYQPSQPTVDPPTTQQSIYPPVFPQPARPLYPRPLMPRRPQPTVAPIDEPSSPERLNLIDEFSTPRAFDVDNNLAPLPINPAPVVELNGGLEPLAEPESPADFQPNPLPDLTLPTTSGPIDNDEGESVPSPSYPQQPEDNTTEFNPELIPIPEPVPNPLPLPDVRPEPVSEPTEDPELYIPKPAPVLPAEPQDISPTLPPTHQPTIPPAPATITAEPIGPVRPTPSPVAYVPLPEAPVGPAMIPMGVLPVTQLQDFQCDKGNAYYAVTNDCDAYIECQRQRAYSQTCPDGLHFNPQAIYPEYPCAYPSEVKCDKAASKQKAQPTAECPRQYGFFPLSEEDCSRYLMCQQGKATVMNCPFGLVFNDLLSGCDWPENVPRCSLSAFKDFTCPIPSSNDDPDLLLKFRYGSDCKMYVACQRGHPRLLKCDPGMSFDETSQVCIDSDLVANCGAIFRY